MAGDLENAPPIEEDSLVVGVIRRHMTHTFSLHSFFSFLRSLNKILGLPIDKLDLELY
jgi:hypothetical protein